MLTFIIPIAFFFLFPVKRYQDQVSMWSLMRPMQLGCYVMWSSCQQKLVNCYCLRLFMMEGTLHIGCFISLIVILYVVRHMFILVDWEVDV